MIRARHVALVLLAGLVLATAAPAQDSLETAKRRELEQLQREAKEKRAQAGRLRGQETRVLGELRRTDRQLSNTRRRLQQLQHERSKLDVQLDVTRASLERSIASLARQRARLRQRLRNLYKYGPARELEFLLSTRSFAELLMRWDFLNMIAQQDRVLLEGIRAEKEHVEVSKSLIEENLDEVSANARKTTTESRNLSTLRQERAQRLNAIKTQRSAYEAAAAELERAARRTQALLARLERQRKEEAERARRAGRNPQPYSGDFAQGQGQLDWPVNGNIVGHFGVEVHPRFGTRVNNDGIDIAAPVGTAVKVVARGRVDFANDDYEGMGGLIVVNHGDGYYTIYGHLSNIAVGNAQEVTPGQVIGRTGEEGSLKGPVLHFEVRKGSTAQDPAAWLR